MLCLTGWGFSEEPDGEAVAMDSFQELSVHAGGVGEIFEG
jgi:hypothetical protein